MTSFEILVSGRVQGVGFRYFVFQKATLLGLFGYVKNMDDGRVKISVSGEKEIIEQLIEYCRIGPKMSNVQDIEIQEIPFVNYDNFKIK